MTVTDVQQSVLPSLGPLGILGRVARFTQIAVSFPDTAAFKTVPGCRTQASKYCRSFSGVSRYFDIDYASQ